MAYKLVEITHEEHLALADAGVWVQWDANLDWGEVGWFTEESIVSTGSSCRTKPLNPRYCYKFYTRLEIEDELQ